MGHALPLGVGWPLALILIKREVMSDGLQSFAISQGYSSGANNVVPSGRLAEQGEGWVHRSKGVNSL